MIQGGDIRELPQPRLHGDLFFCLGGSVVLDVFCSKKSPTGPSESSNSSNLLRGPLVRYHSIIAGFVGYLL